MAHETLAEYLADLAALRIEVGEPSLRDLQKLSKSPALSLPSSTASDLLRGRSRPKVRAVIAFVKACAAHAEKLGLAVSPERVDIRSWQLRLQRIPRPAVEDDPAPAMAGDTPSQPVPVPLLDGRATEMPVFPGSDSQYLLLGGVQFDSVPALPMVRGEVAHMAATLSAMAPWCNTQVKLNLTSYEASTTVSAVARDDSSMLFVHIVTHGMLDERGRLMLVFRDSSTQAIGLSADAVLTELVRNRRRPFALILDMCSAGAVAPPDALGHASPPLAIMTAADADEAAFGGPCSLTSRLADLLRDGDADLPPFLTLGNMMPALGNTKMPGADTALPTRDIQADRRLTPTPGTVRLLRGGADNVVLALNRRQFKLTSEL